MNRTYALVVDDSKSARFAMRRFLENCGHEVETADSAVEALDKLGQRRPDVIFLDHVMPVMDGFEMMAVLRRDRATASLPVVLCSSNDGLEFVELARSHGARDVIVKPPSAEQLTAVLERLQGSVCPAPATEPEPPLPVPGRVQIIRDPELAIEHAVMKTLRDALPAAAASPMIESGDDLRAAPSTTAPPPTLLSSMTAPSRSEDSHAPKIDAVREQFESQLQQVTRELVAQIGALRTQIAQLETAGSVARTSLDERQLAVQHTQQDLESRLDRLASHFDGVLSALRHDIDAQFAAQSQRIDRVARETQAAAIEEAHAVSERVVLNSAKRISDQIAESILNVLKPHAAQQAR